MESFYLRGGIKGESLNEASFSSKFSEQDGGIFFNKFFLFQFHCMSSYSRMLLGVGFESSVPDFEAAVCCW